MRGKSNVSAGKGKAVKQKAKNLWADSSLFPYATGCWARESHGKLHHVGKAVEDPKAYPEGDSRGAICYLETVGRTLANRSGGG